jgi:hypothetical protein
MGVMSDLAKDQATIESGRSHAFEKDIFFSVAIDSYDINTEEISLQFVIVAQSRSMPVPLRFSIGISRDFLRQILGAVLGPP